tara:strand:- start:140 stop:643 length:504 start_codon:yes stop_codon:yes gene_type:complete
MNNIIYNLILGASLILMQSLFLNNINFLEYLNPFIYIYFIIYYPIKNNRSVFIILAFIYGLLIDLFSDTHGIHAASTLCIAYFRPYLLKLFFGMAYEHQVVKFNSLELKQNIFYLFSMIIIHHIILFSLEVINLSQANLIFNNIISNSIFTFISIYVLYEFLMRKSK